MVPPGISVYRRDRVDQGFRSTSRASRPSHALNMRGIRFSRITRLQAGYSVDDRRVVCVFCGSLLYPPVYMLCGRKASGLLPLVIARIALLRGEYSDFVSALINMVLSSGYRLCFIVAPPIGGAVAGIEQASRDVPGFRG